LLAQNSSLQFLFWNFRIFNGRLPGILSPGFMIPGETNLRNIFAWGHHFPNELMRIRRRGVVGFYF
jgi:hypothetical protein